MRPLRALSVGIVLVVSAAPGVASAGAARKSAGGSHASGPLAEGKRLMAAGNYAEACPKIAEAQSQTPSPVTALTLAICYEKAGKLATAWSAYKAAADVASSAHKMGPATAARKSAARLEGKVSRLTIRIAGAKPSGLEVRRDGDAVPDSDLGNAVPLDGGGHDVEVTAPNKKSWKGHVDLAESGQNETMDVPELEDENPAPVAKGPSAPKDATSDATGEGKSDEAAPGQGQRVAGIVTMSLGAAGVILGSVAGLEANSKYHQALTACNNSTACQPGSDGPALRQSAGTWATVSTAAFIAGGVALAGGAVLWFTAPSGSGHPAATTMGIAPSQGGTGLSLVGRF